MSKILVTGGANGLGACIVKALKKAGHEVFVYDLKDGYDVCNPIVITKSLDVLINAAGVNRIAYLEDLSADDHEWEIVMNTNAKGILKMSRAYLPQLIASKGTILNIVSNASHTPMTASIAYNASKGAAAIMTQQMARELTRRHGITVFGISPNKLKGTCMSNYIDEQVPIVRGWSKEYAKEYQQKSLLTGEETDPNAIAEFIAFLLQDKDHHKYLTGCDIPYGI